MVLPASVLGRKTGLPDYLFLLYTFAVPGLDLPRDATRFQTE